MRPSSNFFGARVDDLLIVRLQAFIHDRSKPRLHTLSVNVIVTVAKARNVGFRAYLLPWRTWNVRHSDQRSWFHSAICTIDLFNQIYDSWRKNMLRLSIYYRVRNVALAKVLHPSIHTW